MLKGNVPTAALKVHEVINAIIVESCWIKILLIHIVRQQKIKLTKELEKEAIDTKLSRLLKTFKTKDLDLKTINKEVEIVRQEIYDKQKRESNI